MSHKSHVELVLWHIQSLYSGNASCAESNIWLTDFVTRSSDAWEILLQLLASGTNMSETVQFFSCQGLYLKLSNANAKGNEVWRSCPDTQMPQKLLSVTFHLLASHETPPSTVVGRRLCLILTHLFLRLGFSEEWQNPIADVFKAFSAQKNMQWLVEVLSLLPVELESNRYCPPDRIVVIATALRRLALPEVLIFVKKVIRFGGTREQCSAWRCLVGWCQSSARVNLGTPFLLRLRTGYQHLCFEANDDPVKGSSPDLSIIGIPNVHADRLGISLAELFQSGIGMLALRTIDSSPDFDIFNNIIEAFSEILLTPSPSSFDEWLLQDGNRILYDAHRTCICQILECFLQRWRRRHVASTGLRDLLRDEDFLRGGILDGDQVGDNYTGRVLALLSIIGEHHRGVWLRGEPGVQGPTDLAIHFVQLMIVFTKHPNRKIAIEALRFWDMFTDLRCNGEDSNAWAPTYFMQWLESEKILNCVLDCIICGCKLPSGSATWFHEDLSEEKSAYDEYRMHTHDTLDTILRCWPLPINVERLSLSLCAAYLGRNADPYVIEAVLWVMCGVLDSTDILEEDDYESEDYVDNEYNDETTRFPLFLSDTQIENAVDGSMNIFSDKDAGPWRDLLRYIAQLARQLNDTSSPYLVSSMTRLGCRLMPIISECSNYALPLLLHLCPRSLTHDMSRVVGAELFYEICRRKGCQMQILRVDTSLAHVAHMLFEKKTLGESSHSLFQHLRSYPVTQMRVIDGFVCILMQMPHSKRLYLSQSTIQRLIEPLSLATQNLDSRTRLVHHDSEHNDFHNGALQQIQRDLHALGRAIASIPKSAEGIAMLRSLIVSVLHPILNATNSVPSVVEGVSTVYQRVAVFLESPKAAALPPAHNIASMFVNDITLRFCQKPDSAWLRALGRFGIACQEILPLPKIVEAAMKMRSAASQVGSNLPHTFNYEWVCLVNSLRNIIPRDVFENSIGKQIVCLLKDSLSRSVLLCFPSNSHSSTHQNRGSILKDMVQSINLLACVSENSSQDMHDLHCFCIQFFSHAIMTFTRPRQCVQNADTTSATIAQPSMIYSSRRPFTSLVAKAITDLLRSSIQTNVTECVKSISQSAFQKALATEICKAFAPISTSAQAINKLYVTIYQAAHVPSSHKAKTLVQRIFNEIKSFCELDAEERATAFGNLSFFR